MIIQAEDPMNSQRDVSNGTAARSLLFIERSPALRPLKKLLRKRNLFIFECPAPEKGLRLLQEFRFDFILIDLFIAGSLNGYDFCKKLKEDPGTKAIPLFLFSNHPLPQEVARSYFFDLKADRLIFPPFDLAPLYQQVCFVFQS